MALDLSKHPATDGRWAGYTPVYLSPCRDQALCTTTTTPRPRRPPLPVCCRVTALWMPSFLLLECSHSNPEFLGSGGRFYHHSSSAIKFLKGPSLNKQSERRNSYSVAAKQALKNLQSRSSHCGLASYGPDWYPWALRFDPWPHSVG